MKIWELIDELKRYDEEANVMIYDGNSNVHIDEVEAEELTWGKVSIILK